MQGPRLKKQYLQLTAGRQQPVPQHYQQRTYTILGSKKQALQQHT